MVEMIMSKTVGMNNDTLKRRNRGLILQLIATGTCSSRIEIARRIGLSKMSVSNVVAEYMEQGFVREESSIAVKGVGRNPVSLRISPDAPGMIGLYVFREECVALLCDLQLNILDEYRVTLNSENAQRLDELICYAVDQVMPKTKKVLGIGIGSIGPIDLKQKTILAPPNFFGIHDFSIAEQLQKEFDLPAFLDSQYNCAALAEKYYGAAKLFQDFIFVGISNGIGSGIVSDGEILRNQSGFTSELGHMSIDWRGNLCSCGNRGCLETYAGTRVMEQKLRQATGKALCFREFCELAEDAENDVIHEIFVQMADALSCALINVVNLLNPQTIIIGHEGDYLPEYYLKHIETYLNRNKLVQDAGYIRVMKSAFGASTQVIGSACSLLAHVFQGDFI